MPKSIISNTRLYGKNIVGIHQYVIFPPFLCTSKTALLMGLKMYGLMLSSVQWLWAECACITSGPNHGQTTRDLTGASFSEITNKARCFWWVLLQDGSTYPLLKACHTVCRTVNLVSSLDADSARINYKPLLGNPLKCWGFMLPKK